MKRSASFKKIIFGIAILGLLLNNSCKEEEKVAEIPEPVPQETSTAPTTTKTVKVNPAHGLPGHTCSLPVGAPLNSETKIRATTPAASTTISPLRKDQTPKVNPPHGEPGHTCSLPVGATLE